MTFFNSPNDFAKHIESIVRDSRMTHMDAVLKYCADNFLDPEDIKKMLSKPLIEKIKIDAMNENMIPKTDTLSEFE